MDATTPSPSEFPDDESLDHSHSLSEPTQATTQRPASSVDATKPEPAPLKDDEEDLIFMPSPSYSITKSARRIFRKLAPLQIMFAYYGEVVELCRRRHGDYELKRVSPSAFRSRVEALGTLLKHGSDAGKPVIRPSRCSEDSAKALLATKEALQFLPPISSLVSSPVIIATGNRHSAVLTKGYHERFGGLLITKGDAPIEVAPEEAKDGLLGLLQQFQFATPSDKTRALAAILTPALVFAKLVGEHRVPIFVVKANASGTGKGYFTRLVTAIYGESPKPVAQRDGGVGGFDEDFNARLFEGHPFIVLDNLRGKLSSMHIESFLTADSSFLARTPHRSSIDVDPARFIVLATSNGFETTPDLHNRSLVIELRKQPAGYHFRRYSEGDLIAHTRARQAYFLGCVHAVIREWIARGSLQSEERRHLFDEWARTVDWIVSNLCKGRKLGRLLDQGGSAADLGASLRDLIAANSIDPEDPGTEES